MHQPRVLSLILAGGAGGRLGVLTDNRAKPALPVGGTYRMIDIPLSNLHNSGFADVWIVEQYQPKSINDHLASGRPWDLDRTNGGLRVLPPFQGNDGEGFAEGNADGIFRQADYIREYAPDLVLVLSADHLYRLDYRDVVQAHSDSGAVLTMVTTRFDGDASQHGVVEAENGLVTGFQYKPDRPATDIVTAEVFLYDTSALLDTLEMLHAKDGELQDYGHQLVPYLVENAKVAEHRLEGYWRDLGRPENYHRAHMDLVDGRGFAFDDPQWPMLTGAPRRMPAFVTAGAQVEDSLLSPGSTVHGRVVRSVIGPDTIVEAGAVVRDSVLLEGVTVAAGARLTRTIVDAGAAIGPDRTIDGTEGLITVDGAGQEHS
ncbi:glucose-1-phosphate adenylyltransferase family protein [Arthrobacter sp. TMN-37]